MPVEVYERLAQALDELPGGFPRTRSGVELRLLRRMFTPDEAALALHLNLISEPPRVIARRARLPVEQVTAMLAEMERKGLIYGSQRPGKPPEYLLMQFVIGSWEGQVNRLDADMVHDFEEYLPTLGTPEKWATAPQLRTVPVQASLTPELKILPYEDAENLLRAHDRFAVMDCICRKEMRILDHDCGKPLETCLSFGSGVDYIVRSGRGREISRAEALAVLRQADETGLVLQPGNDQQAGNICACCGCCCGVLRTLKRHPQPATLVTAPFIVRLAAELCIGCGVCVERCQMDALRLEGAAVLDAGRCIGCGLCVSTCPQGALRLERKPQNEQKPVPPNLTLAYIRHGQAQGKLSYIKLAGWKLRSLIDRLMTFSF